MVNKKNFWNKIPHPIYALAPMTGITDSAFRQICKEFGADVLYSEMASVAALVYAPAKTLKLLRSSQNESPYVAQLFGSKPEHFVCAVKLLTDKKQSTQFTNHNFRIPDGLDINFGCPVPKIFKQGAGAALMPNLKQARAVIEAVINNTELPVSIKLRAKSGETDCLEFLNYMRNLPISAVMIHGRTYAQSFSGEIDCGIIKKARNYFGGIILANGVRQSAPNDANSRQGYNETLREYYKKVLKNTGADGIGIARAALGNPWLFREVKTKKLEAVKEKNIFEIALKHAQLAYKLKGKQGIMEMKKHLCWYVHGLHGASAIRRELVKIENYKEIRQIFKNKKMEKLKEIKILQNFS